VNQDPEIRSSGRRRSLSLNQIRAVHTLNS
jgi:hypothetical protein